MTIGKSPSKLPQRPQIPKLELADSFDSVGVDLDDPSLLRIAQDLLGEFKAATYRVGLGLAQPEAADSWEALINSRLEVVPEDIRARAAHQLQRNYENPLLRQRELGRFAKIDLRSPKVLLDPRPPLSLRRDVGRLAALRDREGVLAFHDKLVLGGATKGLNLEPQDYRYRAAEFRLDKVYCVDETGADWMGSDEIDMGGTSVDETGEVKKINSFRISHDFDTGETKNFSPDKQVTWFNVTEGADNWPKVFRVTLALVERDWGDFPGWLEKLYDKTKSRVKSYLTAVMDRVGGAVGGAVGALVSAVSGWVIGWVVDNAIGWIKSLWEDDLIGSKTFTLTHAGPRATFNGSARSGTLSMTWSGAGGKYRTYTYWRLFNP